MFKKAYNLKLFITIAVCVLLPLGEVYSFQAPAENLRLPVGDSIVRIDDADKLVLCREAIKAKFETPDLQTSALEVIKSVNRELELENINSRLIRNVTLPDVIEKAEDIKELMDICIQIYVLAIQMSEKEMDMDVVFGKAVPRVTSIADNIEELIGIMVLARHLVGNNINPEKYLREDIPVEIVRLKEEKGLNRAQVFKDLYDLEISSKKQEGKVLSLNGLADNPSQPAYLNTKGISLAGTRSIELPKKQNILVFEIGKDTSLVYQGNNITKLKENNNVKICTLDVTKGIKGQVIKELNKRAFKPDIVMLPNPVILPDGEFIDNEMLAVNNAVKEWADENKENLLGLGYETIESLNRHNLFIYYNDDELETKDEANNKQASQMTRVPYYVAASQSNKTNAIAGRNISEGMPEEPYAEAFTVLKVDKNGEVTAVDNLKEVLNIDGKINFFADGPHTDDLHIALSVLAKRIQKAGGNIIHSVYMTGHRAFIQGIDDRLFRIRRDFDDEHIKMLRDALTDGLYLPKEWRSGIQAILDKLENNRHLNKDEELLAKKMMKIKIREQETLKSDEVLGIKDTRFYRFPAYDHIGEQGERLLGSDPEYDEFYEVYQALEEMYRVNPNIVAAIPSILDKHPDHRFTHKTRLSAVKEFAKNKGIEIPVILYVAPWFGPDNMYTYLSEEEQSAKFEKAKDAGASLKDAVMSRENALGITAGELVQFEFGADPHSVYEKFGMTSEGLKVFWIRKQSDTNIVHSAGEPKDSKDLLKYLLKKQPQIDPSVLPIKKVDNIPERIAEVVQAQRDLGILMPVVHWDVIKIVEDESKARIVKAKGAEGSEKELSADKLGEVIEYLGRQGLPCYFDVHLMVEDLSREYIREYIKKGANMVTLHWEAFENTNELADRIRYIESLGCSAGLAFNPDVNIDDVISFIKEGSVPLHKVIDLFLQMSVEPGKGGQEFHEEVLPKIRKLKEALKEAGSSAIIQVDGGVKPKDEIMKPLIYAGVNLLVAGSAVLSASPEPIDEIKVKLRKFDKYIPPSVKFHRNSVSVSL